MSNPTGYLINTGDRVLIANRDGFKSNYYNATLIDIDMDGTEDTIQLDDGDTKVVDRSNIFPVDYEKTMEYNGMKEELNIGICEIIFTKKNGEERVMSGTLNFDHIPTEKQPKGTTTQHQTSKDTIAVFDVMKEDWRSFRVDSVIDFERLTGPGRGSDKPKKEVEDEKVSS